MGWWRGPPADRAAAGQTAAHGPRRQAAARAQRACTIGGWSQSRVALVQQVWGQGFAKPGGEDAALALLEPLGLSADMHVLELGAGLGGTTRLAARRFGAQVTGFEPNPALARAGMALSTTDGLSGKAPVRAFDLMKGEPGTYDCVISSGHLFSVRNKCTVLHVLESLLNAEGQIHFTDFALPSRKHRSKALTDWMASDPERPSPWSAAGYTDQLKLLKFDIYDQADITGETAKTITRAWAAHLAGLQQSRPDRTAMAELLEEFEIWARRVKLLESGDLQVCRIHAGKRSRRKETPKPPPTKPKIQLMSNW